MYKYILSKKNNIKLSYTIYKIIHNGNIKDEIKDEINPFVKDRCKKLTFTLLQNINKLLKYFKIHYL